MKPHKHAELIKAWADGAVIQKKWINTSKGINFLTVDEEWKDEESPAWYWNQEYRIKPEPKPDFYKAYLVFTGRIYSEGDILPLGTVLTKPNLKLTFDGETGELKSAEVLK